MDSHCSLPPSDGLAVSNFDRTPALDSTQQPELPLSSTIPQQDKNNLGAPLPDDGAVFGRELPAASASPDVWVVLRAHFGATNDQSCRFTKSSSHLLRYTESRGHRRSTTTTRTTTTRSPNSSRAKANTGLPLITRHFTTRKKGEEADPGHAKGVAVQFWPRGLPSWAVGTRIQLAGLPQTTLPGCQAVAVRANIDNRLWSLLVNPALNHLSALSVDHSVAPNPHRNTVRSSIEWATILPDFCAGLRGGYPGLAFESALIDMVSQQTETEGLKVSSRVPTANSLLYD
ncbi:uncharacterized protein BDZ83DRAFT_648660 [Colletotrichum acutatum]|uniref:Uncharacterized protein n=1 Tax=Glomerella acutata TaxID=27357 RepID=A0AAD8UR03_GLOAC|nr:uncharacterized protein BDZ83DRAFT_648660 [Colletotrichum acutatum]KAK1728391.1 hypothetical protein BDZ83DRAFT_648660 [Colletotrichum acutatum]